MTEINWIFKPDINEDDIYIDDFWLNITFGGYIIPDELLSDECQIKMLKEAIAIVESFEVALEKLKESNND